MMTVQDEQIKARIEAKIEDKGIEFNLPIDTIDSDMYDGLLAAMLEYIGKYTDRPAAYIGDWEITIKAKDIIFERG